MGGKFLEGETPDECLLREAKEETGLTLTAYKLRGIVTFLTENLAKHFAFRLVVYPLVHACA